MKNFFKKDIMAVAYSALSVELFNKGMAGLMDDIQKEHTIIEIKYSASSDGTQSALILYNEDPEPTIL